jgi:hypothetical protein
MECSQVQWNVLKSNGIFSSPMKHLTPGQVIIRNGFLNFMSRHWMVSLKEYILLRKFLARNELNILNMQIY